jgi:hypothetical protein
MWWEQVKKYLSLSASFYGHYVKLCAYEVIGYFAGLVGNILQDRWGKRNLLLEHLLELCGCLLFVVWLFAVWLFGNPSSSCLFYIKITWPECGGVSRQVENYDKLYVPVNLRINIHFFIFNLYFSRVLNQVSLRVRIFLNMYRCHTNVSIGTDQ